MALPRDGCFTYVDWDAWLKSFSDYTPAELRDAYARHGGRDLLTDGGDYCLACDEHWPCATRYALGHLLGEPVERVESSECP